MAITDDARLNAWLTLALVESLTLNIELIERINDFTPPDLRGSPTFRGILERVELLKETRRYLAGESEDEAPA